MNRLHCIFLLFLVLVTFSCRKQPEIKKGKLPAIADVIVAEKTDFNSSIEVNGVSLSEEMIELHPEISGRLTYLNIPDGATVKKGTLLAKVNDADLQAQLEQQIVQLELAVKTEQRLKELLAVNGINQADYDAALSQVNAIHANIRVLNAQIDKTVIKAPFNGTLGLRMVSPGAYVTPQTLLGTLQQTDRIKVDFTLPDSYSGLVKVGEHIFVRSNESDSLQSAIVSAIEPQVNPDTRNLKIRARLVRGNINPGKFVKVILSRTENVFVVPSNALIPDASSNQLIVIRNRKPFFVNVETGIRNADMVEILNGVSARDTIVVTGVLFIRPNSPVKIRKILPLYSSSHPDPNHVVK